MDGEVIDRVQWQEPRGLGYSECGEPGSTVMLCPEPGDEYGCFHLDVFNMLLKHEKRIVDDVASGRPYALDYVHEGGCSHLRDDSEPYRCRVVAELVELAAVPADGHPLAYRYWVARREGRTRLRGSIVSGDFGEFLTFFLDHCGRLHRWDEEARP
jgi:hypothetical protein